VGVKSRTICIVPRNRSDVPRADKLDEIVDAARDRLVDGGYSALSVADIARQLGLAQNAIYWYFPTKDHLLVAAVERILHDVLERKPRRGTPVTRVLWFADQLYEFQALRLTIRERAQHSEAVAEFERNVVSLLRVMLVNSLSEAVDRNRLENTADAILALCEGVLLRDFATAHRRRVLRFGVEQLIASTTTP
jgi:AcrR family transcriptional regulator